MDAVTQHHPASMQIGPECSLNESTDVCVCFGSAGVRDYCSNTGLFVYSEFIEGRERMQTAT